MTVDLDRWVPEVLERLDRAPSLAELAVRELADRVREEVRQRDSGEIGRSVEVRANGLELTVTSDHPGAGLLEHGGIVRGRPWLAIPLRAARGLAGPRVDPNDLFVLTARDGRKFLAANHDGSVELRWRLAHQVEIGPRPVIGPAVEAAREGFARGLLEDLTDSVLGRPR